MLTLFHTSANLPERIRMITLNPPKQDEGTFLDLNATLLPQNPESALVVKIDEDSLDFEKGDLLVVDTQKAPTCNKFVLYDDHTIERWSTRSDGIIGVVTAVIRQL